LDESEKPGSHPNRVRELREDRLMTQAQLARKAKVALRTIHSVEKGMNCRMDTKRKILLALGMRFEDKDQVFPPGRRSFSAGAGLAALAALSAGPRSGGEDNLS
jgi:DNA-binding XRE family transcriptional regulator